MATATNVAVGQCGRGPRSGQQREGTIAKVTAEPPAALTSLLQSPSWLRLLFHKGVSLCPEGHTGTNAGERPRRGNEDTGLHCLDYSPLWAVICRHKTLASREPGESPWVLFLLDVVPVACLGSDRGPRRHGALAQAGSRVLEVSRPADTGLKGSLSAVGSPMRPPRRAASPRRERPPRRPLTVREFAGGLAPRHLKARGIYLCSSRYSIQ